MTISSSNLAMRNLQKSLNHFLPFLCFLLLSHCGAPLVTKELIPIGVILDLSNSSIGSMADTSISMALHDFYREHAHYKTRLLLRRRDSKKDVVKAAFAASDLIKNEKVHAIIGPQWSDQAKFMRELGSKSQVPIISFSATSPSLSPTRNDFFIRTAQDDCSQVKAIAAIVEAYGWREIVLIYEDTEYGNGLIPYLIDAFVKINTRVPYRVVIDPKYEETQNLKELQNIITHTRTKIFVVHMTAEHGSKLFLAAKNASMMEKGYAWIVTEGLSTLLEPVGAKGMDSMNGVLGVRPRVPMVPQEFRRRWEVFARKENTNTESPLTLFGLWAYDTVWALAMAVEKAGLTNSSYQNQNVSNNTPFDFADIVGYETGPRLRKEILATNFSGVSGNFSLIKGQLEPSEIEIFNLVGRKEKIIGYWSSTKSNLKAELKAPIWPGNTTERPTKLRIGVPVRTGFREFLNLKVPSPNCIDCNDTSGKISGSTINVFQEVLKVLPFRLSCEFCPFAKKNGETNGTYDELVMQIEKENFDAVVGDVTVVAHRTEHVDFTLPYSESGVSMVVPMKQDQRINMWIFLKPLRWDLWLTTGAAFIFTGVVIWLLEHRTNPEFRGSPQQQLGTIFWFSFSTLVFAHKEKIVNNWSRLVLIVWVFVVLIITQSYTASLASILTVQRLQPAFMDIKEIQMNNYDVGYQTGSFVKNLLVDQLGFNDTKLKAYGTAEEFHEALSNGTVAAIFDEIPYLNALLKKYGSKYNMVGPVYKTGGFGFAFPLNSPLVSDFSKAILNVIEDQEKCFSTSGIIFDDGSVSVSSDSSSLTVNSFGGLFIITLATSLLSLIFHAFKFLHSQWPALKEIHSDQGSLWVAITEIVKRFDLKDSSFPLASKSNSRVFPVANPATDEASVTADDATHNESTTPNQQSDIVALNEYNQMDNHLLVPNERHSSPSL